MRLWKRRDEPTASEAPAADTIPTAEDVKRAYDRGRADERARHKGHPVLALVVAVVALAGVGLVYLAAREGSFSRGGQLIDQKISVATNTASEKASEAVTGAGDKVAGAGERVKQAGESLHPSNTQP